MEGCKEVAYARMLVQGSIRYGRQGFSSSCAFLCEHCSLASVFMSTSCVSAEERLTALPDCLVAMVVLTGLEVLGVEAETEKEKENEK